MPGKNIAPVAGKPLIAWTIAAARSAERIDRLLVSTDDAAIADVARACGAEVPFLRPAELASDQASHISCRIARAGLAGGPGQGAAPLGAAATYVSIAHGRRH